MLQARTQSQVLCDVASSSNAVPSRKWPIMQYLNRKYLLMHLCRHNNNTVNRGFPGFSSNQNHHLLETHKPQTFFLPKQRTKSIISLSRLAAEILPLQLYKYRGSPYQNNQRRLIWQNSFGIQQPLRCMYTCGTAGAMYVLQ